MSFFQRLQDALGLGASEDELEYDYEYSAEESSAVEGEWQDDRRPTPNNVVGMPNRTAGQTEMLVMEPRSFEDIPLVVTALKQRKSVILNLSLVDADTAQRCVDFVAGGAYAIDGHQERVGETIFLFTPGFVQISNYVPTALEPQSATVPVRRPAPQTTPPIERADHPNYGRTSYQINPNRQTRME